MKRSLVIWGLIVLISGAGIGGIYLARHADSGAAGAVKSQEQQQRSLQYKGMTYLLPERAERIVVTGALEALEDLLLLGVKPAGVMTIGGVFPALFADITADAQPIGERMQPSLEAILKLRPDVIVSSDKFPAATTAQLQKIAPTIPISHFPSDGEANLQFLGELTGRQERAQEILASYRKDLAEAKKRLPEAVKNKKVVAIRIRVGNIFVYPPDVFYNDILYQELGLAVPVEIKSVKAQEVISMEKFSEIDPDYIFLQYEVSESPANPRALEDLQRNPVWQRLKAVKNGRVFINSVDPLIQGVAVGGKIQFLHAAVEKLSQ
ncbi:ABC transporter substrate-binding protein|uniref:Iron complex transport system substrate-binding protein n=1 Tax=Dendrosporobacter quercicolus TaxID=146817 RepID=A0A1G9Y0C8_9FIRM|nr:ABC transporter substrate-binding protein [Dendrosporobacter quercicolus]NSL49021.1 ABC transporter substrate-binding protein [Dendrosporobacter quercicolus DSM 1736]SDN02549.1 iron complex transport system substrate-binding protein [Dendrosporobacter quercicolus]